MYLYDCNAIKTTETMNRSDKEMKIYFTSLTEDLNSQGIHAGYNSVENEASTALKLNMMTINLKYQLGPTSKHIANSA